MNIVAKLYHEIKDHWSTPKAGNSISYKETLLHGIGGNGESLFEGINGYAGTVVSSILTASVYGILPMDIWLMGVIVALVSLIRMPLAGFIIDNTNTKLGKFRPLLIFLAIPTALLLVALAYIPAQFMGADGYSARFISFTIISALLAFFLPTLASVYDGLTQVMTMNTNERSGFFAILNVVRNLFISVMQILLPLLAGFVGGMKSVKIYQISFPVLVIIAIGALLASVFGTKERMIIPQNKSNKVSFMLGLKRCVKNKYFIIKSSSDILASLRGVANIMTWICLYQIGGERGDQVLAVAVTVLGFGHVPGMILAPLIVKKFGKQKSFIGVHILGILTTLPMLLFLKSPYVLLAMLFVQNLSNGLYTIEGMINADILDYEQHRSGERLEGFFNNFRKMIITLFGIGTALITPYILQTYCGIGRDMVGTELDNAYNALFDETKRNKVFVVLILIAAASFFLGMIPIFFYGLTEEKHAQIIKDLKARAEAADGGSAEVGDLAQSTD